MNTERTIRLAALVAAEPLKPRNIDELEANGVCNDCGGYLNKDKVCEGCTTLHPPRQNPKRKRRTPDQKYKDNYTLYD